MLQGLPNVFWAASVVGKLLRDGANTARHCKHFENYWRFKLRSQRHLN